MLTSVVGVYVGMLGDGQSACLKVTLAKPAPEIERQIPRGIEGYPLVSETPGKIRPLCP